MSIKYEISILKKDFKELIDNAEPETKTCKKLKNWVNLFQDAINEYQLNTTSTNDAVNFRTELHGNRSRLYDGNRRAGVMYFSGIIKLK